MLCPFCKIEVAVKTGKVPVTIVLPNKLTRTTWKIVNICPECGKIITSQ